MLKFMRNKVVGVRTKHPNTLLVHGVLEDDLYGLELHIEFSLPDLVIQKIYGHWNHYTTPECPRAEAQVELALGWGALDEDFVQKAQKVVGRQGCRHYANLLVECADTARHAARVLDGATSIRLKPVDTPALTGKDDEPPPSVQESKVDKSPPRQAPELAPFNGRPLVIDIHAHTSPASPCSDALVDELIQQAKDIGLDGICLTDHNYLWSEAELEALRQKHNFLVLGGNEITTDRGDVLVFGFYEDIKNVITLADLHERVKSAGGYMVLAHPFRGFLVVDVNSVGLSAEKAAQRDVFGYVDAMEVHNGKLTASENAFSIDVANIVKLPQTGGSDAHKPDEVGVFATRFFADIENETDLVRALHSGRFEPVAFLENSTAAMKE
jgi:predicted metal-dependent phosphoesterase TrpH